MANVSPSKRLAAPAAFLLLLVMVAGAVAEATLHEATDAGNKDDDAWTDWAKDKVSEGLGLKHHDEEEAARMADHTVKSARESAQRAASGERAATIPFVF
jgi:hypothetical protein